MHEQPPPGPGAPLGELRQGGIIHSASAHPSENNRGAFGSGASPALEGSSAQPEAATSGTRSRAAEESRDSGSCGFIQGWRGSCVGGWFEARHEARGPQRSPHVTRWGARGLRGGGQHRCAW